MSNAELIPLFPSATHPAIPIASRILSTLRTLTAPGKGNDIKPEERAALVGVAAVLGCEKIQSHDLPPSSAQKASSVSPAHFKSALLRARRLLLQIEDKSSSSASTSKRTSPRTSTAPTTTVGGAGPSVDPLSPFTTPRKKFKYSSGIDVSDLLKSGGGSQHKHTPATGSPLKFSSTTKDKEREEDVSRTPTKRVQYGHVRGVDLASVTVTDQVSSSRKKRKDDTSAFMALRPDPSLPRTTLVEEEDKGMPEEEKEYLLSMREKRKKRPAGERSGFKRRDWTCREGVWGSESVEKRNKGVLDVVLNDVTAHLERQGLPPLGEHGSISLTELLARWHVKDGLDHWRRSDMPHSSLYIFVV